MSNYKFMANFCPFPTPVDDPLTYCVMDGASLNNKFAHGSSGGQITPYSMQCQAFMSTRCASNWDTKCEFASNDSEVRYPNMISKCGNPTFTSQQLTAGDILVANTAEKKYGKLSGNCFVKREQFDPTVLTSPFIEYQATPECHTGSCFNSLDYCKTTYDIDPTTIDQDPVMNKILDKPQIAAQLLYKLYYNLKRNNKLKQIENTRLGKFYKYNSELYK